MATRYRIALNMEYCRSADMGFEAGAKRAAELGYRWIEPMLHTGRELLSEAGYFHSFSMEEDPLRMKAICQSHGLRVASFSAHSPLMKPEASVPYLTRAILFADYLDTQFINTDEGIRLHWMDDATAHHVMRYTLTRVAQIAEQHNAYLCIEPHGVYTRTAEGLLKIVELVESPQLAVNWDTGNSYLAGLEDPYEGLAKVRHYVRHVHAKDISIGQSEAERGKVTGTPVGCACGEGVVDWERVFEILDPLDRQLFLSVECGTVDQADRSLQFFDKILGNRLLTEAPATAV